MIDKLLRQILPVDSNKKVIYIVIFSILLNCIGRWFAQYAELPLWLDFYGTLTAAYILGPISGGIVGLFSNAIWSIDNPIYTVYGIVNMVIGLVAGYGARKGYFNEIFKSLVLASVITIAATSISAPLNIFFFEGYTGNIWGDGVIDFARLQGVHPIVASILGEVYINFIDKGILSVAICVFIHYIRKRQGKPVVPLAFFKLKNVSAFVIPILLATSLNFTVAAEKEVDYSSYVQTVYNTENGIPCGKANDIAQTNDGVLWMATYAGLYRYNGKDFILMQDMDSVKKVKCLYADEEGRLWIGTNDSGLSIVIKENVVSVIDKNVGLPSNNVTAITQCSNGNYYIGNSGKLVVASLDGGLKINKSFLLVKNVVRLTADKNAHVAAITGSGELYLFKDDQIIDSKKMLDGQKQFLSCEFDTDGTLLIGDAGNTIHKMVIANDKLVETGSYTCATLNGINSIRLIDGRKYVCAENGVGYFDSNGIFKQIYTNNFNNSIDNMLMDYQGNLWFTSSRLGVLEMTKSVFENMFSKGNLPEKIVNSVTKWNGNFYVGTDTGLYVVNGNTWKLEPSPLYSSLVNTRIRCIRSDSKNNLWICTYGSGVLRMDQQGQIKLFTPADGLNGDRFRTMLELKNGTVVVGGNKGINFINEDIISGGIDDKSGLGKAPVMCFIEQADGSILAGTDGDGIAVIKDGRVVSKITNQQGLTSEVILRLVKDSVDGGVYIVTSNGLCYMNSEGSITPIKKLPYHDIYDIFEGDNNRLFLSSSAGMFIFDREKLFNDEDLSYDLLDSKSGLYSGLTVNSWNYMDDDGYLYLSGSSSVLRLNTNNYAGKYRSMRMLIANAKIDDKRVFFSNNDELFIASDADKVELYPEIINYTVSDPYVSYYLEGVDNAPIVVRQSELSSVVYTNIPAGSYKFILNVLDNDKKTIRESISCTLNKEVKIYDTFIFKAYLIIVFMLMVAWITWFIIRSQLQRTIEYQRKQLELAEKQVKMANETVLAIARAVDAKDENTSQHSVRVAEYSVMIGQALGLSKEDCDDLKRAAVVHDIGKIGIPDSVLNKPARLTDEEYAIMKSHVTKGAKILKDFTLVDHIIEGVLYHHERYDGSGYVHGLKGEEIPLFARIIGVADAFDAMTANRVYRKQMDMDYVRNEFIKGKNKQFDGTLVNILFSLIDTGKIDVNKIYQKSTEKK